MNSTTARYVVHTQYTKITYHWLITEMKYVTGTRDGAISAHAIRTVSLVNAWEHVSRQDTWRAIISHNYVAFFLWKESSHYQIFTASCRHYLEPKYLDAVRCPTR